LLRLYEATQLEAIINESLITRYRERIQGSIDLREILDNQLRKDNYVDTTPQESNDNNQFNSNTTIN